MAYTTLSSVMTAIAADAGVNSATAPQTAFTFIGGIERGRREGPPRVVWTVGDGEFTAPNQEESELSKIGYTLKMGCTVTFLGATFDAAEQLMRDWCAAVQRTQGNNCVTLNRFSPSEETISGLNRYELSVTCTVDLPITFETYTQADVDAVSQTGTITN